MKNKKLIIKILFSTALIALLLYRKVDIIAIKVAFANASFKWVLYSFLLHPIGLLISSLRWQILLKAQTISISLPKLYQSYLVCGFFNQFLPTRVGGDLIRAYDTKVMGYSGVKSFAIVFVERASGLIMLLIFAFAVSLFRLLQGANELIYWVGLFIGLGGVLGVLFLLFPLPFTLLNKVLKWEKLRLIRSKVELFQKVVSSYWQEERRNKFLYAFFLAFLLQINVIFHYYLLGRAFHFQNYLSISEYFVIVPLVQVLLMAPFFINGIGLREGGWIYFFQPFKIASALSFAFSILDYAMYLLFAILGGVLYAFRKGK